MKFSLTMFLFALAATATAQEASGPFGFRAGDDIASYPGCKPKNDRGDYDCTTVPRPHPDLTSYSVWHVAGIGVCSAIATTDPFDSSVYGDEIRRQVDTIAEEIGIAYGKPRKYDFAHAGTIWNEPREWTTAVKLRERTYAYAWEPKKNRVKEIMVRALALGDEMSPRAGSVLVNVHFDNIDRCRSALRKKNSGAF